VARLPNAEVSVDSSLIALGRSCWHEGFDQFFSAASILRDLVEQTNKVDFRRRIELCCMQVHGRRDLRPVISFNFFSGINAHLLPDSPVGDAEARPAWAHNSG
jgi:hypothetical protein